MDLNHRSSKASDLQSDVIDHSTTLPYGDAGEARTPRFRLERAVTLPIRPQHRGTPNETRTRITGLRGQPPIPIRGWEHIGSSCRTRTCGILINGQALYQLS